MSTLKLKIKVDEESSKILQDFRRQYSACFRICYNYIFEHRTMSKFALEKTESELNQLLRSCNNLDLVLSNSWFKQCAIEEAFDTFKIQKDKSKKICFGGKASFKKRCKKQISKDGLKSKRLKCLYSIGTGKPYKGNQKFRIAQDCESIIFQPNRDLHISLQIDGFYRNYKKTLSRLYQLQENKALPITYRLSNDFVWIYFDDAKLCELEAKPVENRVMALDLNPNYVGWSIVDWSGSTENDFKLVTSGVISTKLINDKEYEFKDDKLNSSSKKCIWLSNKRNYETIEIAKKLINMSIHYKCQLFVIEDLNIKSSNNGLGKSFNRLVNNQWCRNKLTNNLKKRCNIFGIKYLEVMPEYSSFIGNFLYRSLQRPDMVLSSIEIGRRGYEFYNQYITQKNKKRKNIIQPNLEDFKRLYAKSLEEFGIKSS